MLEIHIITEGDKDEEKFITYGIGVQVSCCLGTKKHRKIVYGNYERNRLEKVDAIKRLNYFVH